MTSIAPISREEATKAIDALESLFKAAHNLTPEQENAITTAQDALRIVGNMPEVQQKEG